ncbi:MAG: hypothetical protein AB1633_12010 [Elusimicrobiota bacterium]
MNENEINSILNTSCRLEPPPELWQRIESSLSQSKDVDKVRNTKIVFAAAAVILLCLGPWFLIFKNCIHNNNLKNASEAEEYLEWQIGNFVSPAGDFTGYLNDDTDISSYLNNNFSILINEEEVAYE